MKKLIVGSLALLLFACDNEDASPKFTFEGTVTNVTGTPLEGVEVVLNGDETFKTETDEDGEFSIDVTAGEYEIEVEAEGYLDFNDDVEIDDDDSYDIELEGEAIVSGRIINSQTGTGLAEATVAFIREETGSEDVDDAELLVTTDATGNFLIEGGPTGEFIGIVESPDFFTRVVEDVVFTAGSNNMSPVTAVSKPEPGSLRIILSWGVTPYDLDSHFTGPNGSGGRFHMYFVNQNPTPEVSLDVDDTYSYGPETTTITAFRSGSYRFSVYNYSNSSTTGGSGIATSPGQVEIYDSNGMVNSFTAPAFTGSGNTWRVFDLVSNGTSLTVQPINQYIQASGSGDAVNFRSKDKSSVTFESGDF